MVVPSLQVTSTLAGSCGATPAVVVTSTAFVETAVAAAAAAFTVTLQLTPWPVEATLPLAVNVPAFS